MNGFGNQLYTVLKQKNISKVSFAKYLGISETQLHTILSGKSLSTLPMLKKIALNLDVPSDFLLQDYGKQFLIFAIDDYYSRIDKAQAQAALTNFEAIIGGEENDG